MEDYKKQLEEEKKQNLIVSLEAEKVNFSTKGKIIINKETNEWKIEWS